MRLLFTSDLHLTRGRRRALLRAVAEPTHEAWVDTGDLLPNTVILRGQDFATAQRQHQVRWLRHTGFATALTDALAGRPAVILPGNHDFALLTLALRRAGALVLDGTQAQVLGDERLAGLREIPHATGRWAGEATDEVLAQRVAAALATRPTLMLTHAPCRAVMDEPDHASHRGLAALTALHQPGHAVRWHLHGHIHATGGRWVRIGSVTHVNAACHHLAIDTHTGEIRVVHGPGA